MFNNDNSTFHSAAVQFIGASNHWHDPIGYWLTKAMQIAALYSLALRQASGPRLLHVCNAEPPLVHTDSTMVAYLFL